MELSLKNINKTVPGTFSGTVSKKYQQSCLELSVELGVVHLVPAGTRNRALMVPADAAAPWESRCRHDVGTCLANRVRSWSFPRSWHRRRSVGTTAPGADKKVVITRVIVCANFRWGNPIWACAPTRFVHFPVTYFARANIGKRKHYYYYY